MKAVLPYVLTASARADLSDIFDYTERNYGHSQATTYLRELGEAFAELGENPKAGRARPEIRAQLRSFPKGRHVIFYRTFNERIRIVRVLSMSRDIERALKKKGPRV